MQLIVQAAQPAAKLLAHFGVERAERLVQQQHPRLDGQRAGEGDALPLSTGELGGKAVAGPVQLDQLKQLVHLALDLALDGARLARSGAQAKGDVIEHRHVPEQRVVLENKAHLPLPYVGVGGVLTIEPDTAAIGCFQSGDDAQQGRLAAARRAEQGDQFARRKVQRHIVQCLEIAK